MLYVFDVDMTLTESDCEMLPEMADAFRKAMAGKDYYFCSGSQLPKMKMQIPADIMENAAGWFPCMGGEFWQKGEQKSAYTFEWPQGLREDLEEILANSPYPMEKRTSDFIQDRGSMVCFSVVGKAAVGQERHEYTAFDTETKERETFAKALRVKYPHLSFVIGGKTSIDISDPAVNKGVVLNVLREITNEPITFFGDRVFEGGNDWPLAKALEDEGGNNQTVVVKNPSDTLTHLQNMAKEVA